MEPTEQRETLRDLPAAGGLHGLVAGLAAVNGREGAVVGGAVGEEGGALDLLDVVEAGNADEALGEGAGAGADLGEDLLGVGAAVHGELPHDPVAVVVVAGVHGVVHVGPAVGVGVGLVGGLELNAGSPAVVEEVLDLAGDLLVGEGGEEGESLEEPGEGKRGERGVEVSSVDRFFETSFFSAFGRESRQAPMRNVSFAEEGECRKRRANERGREMSRPQLTTSSRFASLNFSRATDPNGRVEALPRRRSYPQKR